MFDHEAIKTRAFGAALAGAIAVVAGILMVANATTVTFRGVETDTGLLIGGWLATGAGAMLLQGAVVAWLLTARLAED